MPGLRLRWAAALVVAAAVPAGCAADEPSQADAFAYPPAAVEVVDRGVVNDPYPVAVHDLDYRSGDDRVEAFLAVPPGAGVRPGVLYLHAAGGDRSQLLEPALWLAARGVVTLTITAPSTSDPPADLPPEEALERFRAQVVRDVVAARRALDVLAARDDVDAGRLGAVGWSAGARAGALLAGVEPRLRAVVLLAPGAAPVSEFVDAAPPDLRDDVERVMRAVDPFAAIARARPGEVLVQAGREDGVVPRSAIEALVDAAPDRTELRWYDAGHGLDEAAYSDHLDWLVETLRVAGPPVEGAATGP